MKKLYSLFATAALLTAALPMPRAWAAGADDLIKCPDFSSVYYLAEDGHRYVFPNENIYFSWYNDFSDVKTISCADLATIPLGDLMTYQAGTSLVKFPSVPTVYAVESDGVLRAIPDEATARALFGEAWSTRVDDVAESFLRAFEIGEDLGEDEIPEGTVLSDDDGNLFRVDDDGSAVEIDTVLDIDQEDILERHALPVDDLERQLGVALALTRVDNEAAIEVLEQILERLKKVRIDDDEVAEVEEIDELEDRADDREDAADAIEDAREEMEKAQSDIAEDQEDGKDISGSAAYLERAASHLAAAEVALSAGDFATAEDHADEAKHEAMWARGKAVESISEDENEHEDTDEDLDEDEQEDEDLDEDEDDGDEDESEDEDDASEDASEQEDD